MKFGLVEDLKQGGYSQRQALQISHVSRSAYQYRHARRPRVEHPIPQAERRYRSRLSPGEREEIAEVIEQGWQRGQSVSHSFAATWDQGSYLACPRQWYRIANTIDQRHRPPRQPRRGGAARRAPVAVATGPGQVWMWDITDLKGTYVGETFKAYVIQDLFSRKIVGHCVAPREDDDIAAGLFAEAFDRHGVPQQVHADNGAAMTSTILAKLCHRMGVGLSFNRPNTSNDNPFKESEFKTMKYRPGYPGVFDSIHAARDWISRYVDWFNTDHRHSGIALHTPDSVHDGNWRHTHTVREDALGSYCRHHPERGHGTHVRQPPALVAINLHHQEQQTDTRQ